MNETGWRTAFTTRRILWCRPVGDGDRSIPHVNGGAKGHADFYLDEDRFWQNPELFEVVGHDLHVVYSDARNGQYGYSFGVVIATDEVVLGVARKIAELAGEDAETKIQSLSANDRDLATAVQGRDVALCLPYIDTNVLRHISSLIRVIRDHDGTLTGDLFCTVHIDDRDDSPVVKNGIDYKIHALVTERRRWSTPSGCVLCRAGSPALVYSDDTQSQFWPAAATKGTPVVTRRESRRSRVASV